MRYYGIVRNFFAMKRILVIVFLISSSFLTQAKDSYEDYFQDEQEEVAQFLRVYEPKLQQKSHKYCHQNNFVTAIIYPELLRYNYVQDFIETAGLELIYIRYGSKTADFSIGHFQMKPSFAEQIEKYIEKYPIEFSKYKKLIFTRKSTSLFQRKIRLVRLKQIDWQLNYIHAFIAICDHKFHFLKFKDTKDKLRFYATCYNVGFHKKYQLILQNENKKTFPHGPKYLGTQFCYASIAFAYYLNTTTMK